MTVKFTNNASTTVGTGINASATSLTVASASSFPSLSGADDYCYLTIQQSTGTVREVVKATALSGNTFTIVRAQDNTSAGTWSAGDIVELRMTAALLTDVIDAATVEGVKTNFQYTPTAGQTVFSGADNASNTMIINQAALVSVYLNGIRLVQGSDYSVSSANNTVTLTAGVTTADIVDVEVFGNFTGQSGAAVAITGGAISGASVAATTLSASGTATLNTFVSSNATISGGTINNVNIGGTTAGTVAATTLTANSVAVDNITLDGNEIDVSSGDLTLDVAGDIILDAAGNDIVFKDAGTTFGQITNDSGNMIIYNAGSQMLKGVGGGANAQFVGNVGIGGAPDSDSGLHLKGDGKRILIDSADHNLVSLGRSGSSGAGLDVAYFRMRNAGTNTVVIHAGGDSYFNGGSVGIGTTDIKEKLSVNGAAVFDGNHATGTNAYRAAQGVMIHAASSTGFVTAVSNGSNDVDLQLRALNGGSANSNQLVLDSEGNVGINTTAAPVRTLDVKGSVNFSVNTSTHETFVFTTGSANDAKLLMQNASSATTVQLQANGDSYFNGGSVGIGTSSIDSDSILHLKAAQPNIYFEDTDDAKSWRLEAGSVFKLQNITTSNEVFRIDQTGNLKLGNSAAFSSPKMYVYGTAVNQNSGYYQLAIESDLAATSTPKAGISFRGEYNTSNGAHMDLGIIQGEKENATSGQTGGQLTFHTREHNGSITERVRISSSGAVTKPYHPAFRVARNNTNYTATAGYAIQFNAVSGTYLFNTGNHYSLSTYRFTAPVAGVYTFHAVIIWQDLSDGNSMIDSFRFRINGTTDVGYGEKRAVYKTDITGTAGYFVESATDTYKLNANDYVDVKGQKSQTVHGNQQYTRFTGYLVG